MANEEQRAQNVEHVLKVAAELLMTYGIDATTKEMIARASGLSRKSIDRYFTDKTDCALRAARWVGGNVWEELNSHYPKGWFGDHHHRGADLLERYMLDLKRLLVTDTRLFVFYTDCKLYFSRHSEDYERDYGSLVDTVGCRYLAQRIYQLGQQDGSLPYHINPAREAAYFCRLYFSLLSSMAFIYPTRPHDAIDQIDRFIQCAMGLYRSESGEDKRSMA
jgi:AcrR family transcriptional regulator